jgi:hypothetical protein
MPVWEVFTYGNGEFLAMVFNAVVALMGDGDFVTLMRLAGIVGLIWVSLKAGLFRTQVEWTWLIWFVLIYGVLFVPKVDVVVVDRLDNNQTRVVANVPYGLGVFAGAASKIGDWFTRGTETVMTLPDDMKYHRNGMVFGSSLVQAASQFEITDGRLKGNMSEFMRQCVFYDVLFRRYTWTELLEADDTWQFIKENTAENARAFAYVHANGTQQIYACKTGAETVLETDWTAEITRAASLYGVRFNKHLSMADASAKLMADLPTSYDYLAGISRSGGDIIRANMMANSFRRAFGNAASATDANAAAQDFALAQAEQQQRSTYAVMGQLAAKFLPLLKNIYEGILFGMFPFLFLIFMLPIGVKIFLSYLKNVIWLQLWAPLYAILNLLMTLYASKASAAAAAQLGGQALSLATHSGLAAVNADIAILAGYMGMSIPLIAYGLVSGGQMALTQFASQVGAVAQSAAQQAGAAASTGNINLANLGAYNTGMFKYDTNAMTNYGQGGWNRSDGAAVTNARDGSEYLSKAAQNVGASLDIGATVSHAKNNTLAHLDQATQSAGRQYADGLASNLGKSLDMSRSTGWGTTKSDGWSEQDSTAYKEMSERAQTLSSELQEKHGFTKEQADKVVHQAYADASVGIDSSKSLAGKVFAGATGISGQAKAGVKTYGEHGDIDKVTDAYETARKSAESDVGRRGVEALKNYATNTSVQNTETGSNSLGSSLRADLQDTVRHEQTWQAARTRQTQAQEAVQRLESSDRTAAATLMYEFMGDLNKSGYAYRDQLTATGNESKLAAAAQEWYSQKYILGADGFDAAKAGANFAMNPGSGQMGNATATEVDRRLGSSGEAVADAAADAQNKVRGPGSVTGANVRAEDTVLHKPLSAGSPYAGAGALGMDASKLGQIPLTDRSDLTNFKQGVAQEADPVTGKGTRAIAEDEAKQQGATGVATGLVEETIGKGRHETEGLRPANWKK